MTRYLVFEPAGASGPSTAAVFLRDRFSVFAFVFTFLWMFRHGLWLWGLGTIALFVAINGLGAVQGFETSATLISLLLGILIGLEAPSLRASKLRRKGWNDVAAFEAQNGDEAELIYYHSVPLAPEIAAPPAPRAVVPGSPQPAAPEDDAAAPASAEARDVTASARASEAPPSAQPSAAPADTPPEQAAAGTKVARPLPSDAAAESPAAVDVTPVAGTDQTTLADAERPAETGAIDPPAADPIQSDPAPGGPPSADPRPDDPDSRLKAEIERATRVEGWAERWDGPGAETVRVSGGRRKPIGRL